MQVRGNVFTSLSVSRFAVSVSADTQKHTYNEHLQVKVRIFHKVSLRSEYKRLRYNDTGEDRVINSGPLQG